MPELEHVNQTFETMLQQWYKADIRLLDEGKQLVEDYGSESLSDSQLWILEQLFAMPETAIGLHPDVGASYFLSRLPGHLGMITFS